MTALYTLEEILDATHGCLVLRGGDQLPAGSRFFWILDEVGPGDWVVCISYGGGEFYYYIESAFDRGARGCIVEGSRASVASLDRTKSIISVADTKIALWQLASFWRRRVAPNVVAVTGSVGRKETIAFLEFLVRKQFRCHVAVDSGALGPLPGLFSMMADTELLIVEASGADRGEVARTASFTEPDLAVITAAHHPLPSPERNARAAALYCEILEALSIDSLASPVFEKLAVINDRNPVLKARAEAILWQSSSHGKNAGLSWLSEANGVSPAAEQVEVSAWCAVTAATCLGLSVKEMPHIVSELIVKAGSYRA
ncbi:MAG TPA: hypothetical protein PKC98_13200 [Candidatus Melainabacteria bacterium]|nr:hypothetical protein [Candidatus Melainabacteria bacterium]